MGELVWKTLWENDSRPFIFQKEIFLKEIYLSYGFVVWVWVEGSRMKYWEPLWVNSFGKHYGKTTLDPLYFRKKSS